MNITNRKIEFCCAGINNIFICDNETPKYKMKCMDNIGIPVNGTPINYKLYINETKCDFCPFCGAKINISLTT